MFHFWSPFIHTYESNSKKNNFQIFRGKINKKYNVICKLNPEHEEDMRKFLTIFALTLMISISKPAQADLVLGADVYRTFIDTSQEFDTYAEDNYDMIAAVLGFDFNGVGIEGFYQFSDDTINGNNFTSKTTSYGADFILRLPTSEYLDFVTSIGYVNYKIENKLRDLESDGLRLGVGFQFNFNKYMAIRAMYHYYSLTEEVDNMKTVNEISAGVSIKF